MASSNSCPIPPQKASLLARYTCAGISCAVFAAWFQWAFVNEPHQTAKLAVSDIHSYHTPLFLTVGYLISLPLLKFVVQRYLSTVDVKGLMKESMILYNISQVVLNGWMVWRFLDAVIYKNHPFIGDIYTTNCGTTYAIWIHYCDKYLEFFDTYFMVLRGRMDQVSFLHVYHHVTIAWAWWAALYLFPGGDSYFGALLNSGIHVLMYSYYLLALLKIPCPWKRFLTQAQLIQFTTVLIYSFFCVQMWPKREFRHLTSIFIQIWEMSSLFVLFTLFYKRSYKGKAMKDSSMTNATTAGEDDQCQEAVKAAVHGAAQVVESATKDAGRASSRVANSMEKQASKVVKRQQIW